MKGEAFLVLLRDWASSACAAWDYPPVDEAWIESFFGRIPGGLRSLLAAGTADGVLLPDGHGFTVAGLARGKGPYAFFSRNDAQRKLAPNWEYFVQVGEFLRLERTLDKEYTLGFEDDLMDITVRHGNELIWCIEVKERTDQLDQLLSGIRSYAVEVDIESSDRGNDPLRKAKYLVRARPQYLSLVAIGKRLEFSVEFTGPMSFELHEDIVPIG